MSRTQSRLADLMGASGWSGAGQATNGVQVVLQASRGRCATGRGAIFPCFEVNDSERSDFKKSDLMCGKTLCCCCTDFHILMFLLLPDGL